jgi:hypothetical protein
LAFFFFFLFVFLVHLLGTTGRLEELDDDDLSLSNSPLIKTVKLINLFKKF